MMQELIVRIKKLEMMKFYDNVSGCCQEMSECQIFLYSFILETIIILCWRSLVTGCKMVGIGK